MGARRYAGLVFNFAVGFFAVIGVHATTRIRSLSYEKQASPRDAPAEDRPA